MIVLDTPVVVELMHTAPDPHLLAWVDAQPVLDLMITSVTAAELRAGAALFTAGRKRARIHERVDWLVDQAFAGFVLSFDVDSSVHYADIVRRRTNARTPIATLDAQTAAICRQHDATLATANLNDFADTGVILISPWETVSNCQRP